MSKVNRGRIQAQGENIEESAPWATDDIVSKSMGIERIDYLLTLLNANQIVIRKRCIQKAKDFVNNAPAEGCFAQIVKSYYGDINNRVERIDVEIRGGNAFNTIKK